MTVRHPTTAVAWTLVVALAGAYCAKAPPPPKLPEAPPVTITAPAEATVKASLTIAAAKETNPDPSGRPSPVVVRIYQLRNNAAFTVADFFALYDDDQKTLGPELITRDEFTLTPAESRTLDVTLSAETRFVGAIAAFRDIRNAQWRSIIPAPRTGIRVAVERASVVVSATN